MWYVYENVVLRVIFKFNTNLIKLFSMQPVQIVEQIKLLGKEEGKWTQEKKGEEGDLKGH